MAARALDASLRAPEAVPRWLLNELYRRSPEFRPSIEGRAQCPMPATAVAPSPNRLCSH